MNKLWWIIATAVVTTLLNAFILSRYFSSHTQPIVVDTEGHPLRFEIEPGEGELLLLRFADPVRKTVELRRRPDGTYVPVETPRPEGGGIVAMPSAQADTTVPPAPKAPAQHTPTTPGTTTTAGFVAGSGTVRGTVSVVGPVPPAKEINRRADPFCAKTPMKDPSLLVERGAVQDVIVHVNGAPPTEPPKQTLVVSQDNCMYLPRVSTLIAGQTLTIKNRDPVLHNVHTYRNTTTVFNQAQIPGGPDIEKVFTDAGALIKLRCDVHQWMSAYVWVQNNNLAMVTGADGKFEIANVPAGPVELELWHERLEPKKMMLVIVPGQPTTADVKMTIKPGP